MKALKVIGIIIAVLLAAILIIPLFSPATVEVSSSTEIALEPGQIFPSVASFQGRTAWDPWLTNDSTASADMVSKPGYVGSTYAWEGQAVGTGKMEVISVKENAHIESHLWFGGAEDPALVEWEFQQVDGGTQVVWSFAQETAYPFGRLGMMIGKGFLKKAFDEGLANLKEVMEANPPAMDHLGPITVETMPAMETIVASGGGTMDEIGQVLGELYGKVFEAVGRQELTLSGPPFAHYLDYDETSGYSRILAGAIVAKPGQDLNDLLARSYPEMKVVQALHTGPYDKLSTSYESMGAYVAEQGLELTGEAFEFYRVGMQDTQDPSRWETLIAMPLK
jgi:effector-binding domain-containing protein